MCRYTCAESTLMISTGRRSESSKLRGGASARYQRYCANFAILDEGMRALGFRRLLPENQLSRVLTAYLEPTHPSYGFSMLHDALHARGFTIYPGKSTTTRTFRLANMGQITRSDLADFISAMGDVIEQARISPLYGPRTPAIT